MWWFILVFLTADSDSVCGLRFVWYVTLHTFEKEMKSWFANLTLFYIIIGEKDNYLFLLENYMMWHTKQSRDCYFRSNPHSNSLKKTITKSYDKKSTIIVLFRNPKKISFFSDMCSMHHQSRETTWVDADHFKSTSVILWGDVILFRYPFNWFCFIFYVSQNSYPPLMNKISKVRSF